MSKSSSVGSKISIWLLLVFFLFSVRVYAAEPDYTITYAGWDDKAEQESGRAVALWERKDDSSVSYTKYRLRLYRGSTDTPVGDWIITGGTKYDFTSKIGKKGTGTYFFVIYPSKGGEEFSVTSEQLEVDSARKKQIKELLENQTEEMAALEKENFENGIAADGTRLPAGWQEKNGNWYYRQSDGKLQKSCWLQENGKWYYLAAGGEMLTGWQAINGKWYYFGTDGVLYVNTVTPDGSAVNENGEWVENGVAVTDDRKKKKKVDSSDVQVLSEFTVSLTEKEETEGEIYKVTVGNTTEARLVETSYSVPREQWVAGEPVTITVIYETYPGYAFADTTVYSCDKASVTGSQAGEDATVRTIVMKYVPNLKLKTPENFYMNSDYTLHWDAVSHAGYYEVRVLVDGNVKEKKKPDGNVVSLDEYMTEKDLEIRVTAMPSAEKKKFIVKSATAYLEDLTAPEVQENILVEGKIRKEANGSMTYLNADGKSVRNQWLQLAGNWYHFNTSGYAENQGWYLDSTGYWYYFDEKHRMVTGTVTVDGTKYTLNDGSNKEIPLGARI